MRKKELFCRKRLDPLAFSSCKDEDRPKKNTDSPCRRVGVVAAVGKVHKQHKEYCLLQIFQTGWKASVKIIYRLNYPKTPFSHHRLSQHWRVVKAGGAGHKLLMVCSSSNLSQLSCSEFKFSIFHESELNCSIFV